MKRIATALVLVPLIIWVVLAAPVWVFNSVLFLIGMAAFQEFDGIAAAHGIARPGAIGLAAGVALLYAPYPEAVVVLIGILAMALELRLTDLKEALPGAGVFVFGVIYIFGAWRCARLLRDINPHWLMIALLVCWAGDTAAYYVGRAFGRHRLAPQVSPGKTWEGTFGSIAGGIFAAAIYAYCLIPKFPVWETVVIGALGNIAGQVGDLCESAFKRGGGMKDSGTMLPGHGGWLDRIDSTLFSVPAVYAALKFMMR